MKMNSLKLKLISLVMACMLANALIIAWLLLDSFQREKNTLAWQALQGAQETYVHLEENCTRTLSATLAALLADEKIAALYQQRDRDKLYRYTAPLFEILKNDFQVTHWYFLEPETAAPAIAQKCFLRVHNAALYGDVVNRVTYKNAVQTKTFSSGKELGKTAFALRVVHPYYHQGTLIGYMELGQEIDEFLSTMQKMTGDAFALIIDKRYLDQTEWKNVRNRKNLPQNWDDMKDAVLINDVLPNKEITRFEGEIEKIPAAGQILEEKQLGKSLYMKGILPVYDAAQRKVGGILILHDITKINSNMKRTLLYSAVSIFVLTLVLGGLIVFVLNRLVFKRLDQMNQTAIRVVGGDYNTKIVPTADDELGQFETLFEQFRNVFVNAVSGIENAESKTIKTKRPVKKRKPRRKP